MAGAGERNGWAKTMTLKRSEADCPARSVALTRISSGPASCRWGVPLKTSVAASKRSQAGSAVPSARVAE